MARFFVQDGFEVINLSFKRLGLCDYLVLRLLKGTFQAPQHNKRKNGLSILVRLEVSPEYVGNRPDKADFVLKSLWLAHTITLRNPTDIHIEMSKFGLENRDPEIVPPCQSSHLDFTHDHKATPEFHQAVGMPFVPADRHTPQDHLRDARS